MTRCWPVSRSTSTSAKAQAKAAVSPDRQGVLGDAHQTAAGKRGSRCTGHHIDVVGAAPTPSTYRPVARQALCDGSIGHTAMGIALGEDPLAIDGVVIRMDCPGRERRSSFILTVTRPWQRRSWYAPCERSIAAELADVPGQMSARIPALHDAVLPVVLQHFSSDGSAGMGKRTEIADTGMDVQLAIGVIRTSPSNPLKPAG